MDARKLSWVPSLVFGAGVLFAMLIAIYATESGFYGMIAALIYTVSLGTANVMERRMGTFNVINLPLRRYRQVTTVFLIVAALIVPGWLPALLLAFGVEGIAQLRRSPHCATNTLKELWRRLRS